MTIFTTHDCHFNTLERHLVAKEYMETQHILKTIAVEALLEIEHNWDNGCYNIKHWLKLSAMTIYYFLAPPISFHAHDWTHKLFYTCSALGLMYSWGVSCTIHTI